MQRSETAVRLAFAASAKEVNIMAKRLRKAGRSGSRIFSRALEYDIRHGRPVSASRRMAEAAAEATGGTVGKFADTAEKAFGAAAETAGKTINRAYATLEPLERAVGSAMSMARTASKTARRPASTAARAAVRSMSAAAGAADRTASFAKKGAKKSAAKKLRERAW